MGELTIDYFKIRKVRDRLKMSQAELAFRVGATQTQISHIEIGKTPLVSFRLIVKICDELNIPLESLLIE